MKNPLYGKRIVKSLSVLALCGTMVHAGSITDNRDGQVYKTVKIGKQEWMASNLNYDVKGSFCMENNKANCKKLGRLYTWTAAMDLPNKLMNSSAEPSVRQGHQGLCPDGWRVPSLLDLIELTETIGGQLPLNPLIRLTENGVQQLGDAGKKLRAEAWDGDDEYGFEAMPTGARLADGSFDPLIPVSMGKFKVGPYANYWLSFEGDEVSDAMFWFLDANVEYVDYGQRNKADAFALRCLKSDVEGPFAPRSAKGTYDATSKTMTDTRDGKIYKTVVIDKRVWMAENLNYKYPGSVCYNRDEEMCDAYGRLYTWPSVMDLQDRFAFDATKSFVKSKHQGVCPAGWHVPTDADLASLARSAGLGKLLVKSDDQGEFWVYEKKAYSLMSKDGWENAQGEDKIGFNMKAAGSYENGEFMAVGQATNFWVVGEYDDSQMGFSIGLGQNGLLLKQPTPKFAYSSLRCVLD